MPARTGPKKLREARSAMLLTQEQLAEMLGVSLRTVTALELDQTTPRLETALAIEKNFGVPLDAWVDNEAAV